MCIRDRPLTLEEIRTLVNEASTRDKAIILSQVSGGLGVGEFLRFAENWKKYEADIKRKTVPLRINMVRPKTKVSYWTLLWDDAVDALNVLLSEREREEGHNPESLFVKQAYSGTVRSNRRTIEETDIQQEIRRLADRTGLEPTRKPTDGTKPFYRIRPHNFRDYFKTACENSEVPDSISEFALGHEVDELQYNQFQKTEEGKKRILLNLQKVRPKVNIITGRGFKQTEESYLDKTLETWAIVGGKDPEVLKDKIVYYTKRLNPDDFLAALKAMIKEGVYRGEGVLEEMIANAPREVEVEAVRRMSKEKLQPVIVQLSKDLNAPQVAKKPEQKVVLVEEAEKYIAEGWYLRSPINHEKVLMEREPQ